MERILEPTDKKIQETNRFITNGIGWEGAPSPIFSEGRGQLYTG